MIRISSGIILFLASFLAQASEKQAAFQPPPSDPTAMIVFAVVLFGGIGSTAWVIWRNEKNRKQRENEEK